MKTVILHFILLFVSVNLMAQDFAPVGAEWYYNERFCFSGNTDYIKFTAVTDSIINGKNCTLIKKRHKESFIERPDIDFIYSSNDTVFFYDADFSEFQILYVFNSNVNDSWIVKKKNDFGIIDTIRIIVDSTSIEQINGFSLNAMHVTYHNSNDDCSFSYPSTIIEKIGDVRYMFNLQFLCFVCGGGYSVGIRCYQDNDIGLYSNGTADSCDYTFILTEVENIDLKSNFNVFPNPTKDYLRVQSDLTSSFNVELFDIDGKSLLSKEVFSNEEIDLIGINTGLYLLKIKSPNNDIVYKKIIIE